MATCLWQMFVPAHFFWLYHKNEGVEQPLFHWNGLKAIYCFVMLCLAIELLCFIMMASKKLMAFILKKIFVQPFWALYFVQELLYV